jgi:hypothetical protein
MARLGRGFPTHPLLRQVRAPAPPHGDLTLPGTPALTLTGAAARSGDLALAGDTALTVSGTKHTGIGVPPRPRTRWQLVLGPASGGHEVALTEATGRKYTARLDGNSDLSFTIDGRHEQAAAIEELSTDVHLLFSTASSTTILDRCRVGGTQDEIDEDSHKTQVSCLDYRAVLARRILYSTDTLTFTGVEQADIAWQLIQATQARPSGDLGISQGYAATGILRDRTYEAGDSIGQRVQELSEVIDGFDWDILPVSASALLLKVWYPQRGSDRDVVLEVGGIAASVSREVNTSDYGNAVRYTGAQGLTAVEDGADLLGDSDAFPQGRWDLALGDDGLTTQGALNDRAAWQLAQSQVVRPAYTVKLAQGAWQGPDHIWLGDTVRLIIPSGRLAVDTTARVHEVEIAMDGNNGEAVTLTLGGPRPDFRRWPSAIERRLKDLERR